ncbi:MAG: aromatic amino acid aminotransferase [Pirellulaceae bacterium]|nr:MAG: aromatic amino acid aminotransferase [Pirellulaceae bacterium]
MLERLPPAPADPILGLSEAFARDPRPDKINLSVGVYQDEEGRTPVLECVKRAQRRLLEGEETKSYLAIDGLASFRQLVPRLVLGHIVPVELTATVQTPGGTAALRVAAELIRRHFPDARIWCSEPTWANHPNVFQAAGLEVRYYTYADPTGVMLDFDGLVCSLDRARPGDVVCLHACCHNPTGLDLEPGQWRVLAERLRERSLLPLVDFAYQGFAEGLVEDATGIRELVRAGLEILIASSFSKNFGLYAERVGALTLVAQTSEAVQAAVSQVKAVIRSNYSNPPKHGGAIVATVLADEELTQIWEREVEQMRERIQRMRELFVATLAAKGVTKDFSFLLRQRGMFSYSGLSLAAVERLRTEYGIYIVGSGRINVAGMRTATMDRLCTAIAAVLEN